MDIKIIISNQLKLPIQKVENTISLLESKNSVPFIARYRKEITGNLDEEQIRNIATSLEQLKRLQNRRETILQSVSEQGKLTKKLISALQQAETVTDLDDLYLPYRPQKKTRADIARDLGLSPLAEMITHQIVFDKSLTSLVAPFLNDKVENPENAIQGACDIVAAMITENATIRKLVRGEAMKLGKIVGEKLPDADDPLQVFEIYYGFELLIKYIKPHQILALNRGEDEKVLRVKILIPEQAWRLPIRSQYPPDRRSLFYSELNTAIEDAASRLLLPSIERDIRRNLSEKAEEHAIEVFAENLKSLLNQPPLVDQVILGIDPGFRTGSKVAVVNQTGELLDTATIHPLPPQNKLVEANEVIQRLIKNHCVTLIVIGNGTASREIERFIAEITENRPNLHYLITNEAGASVYSASKLARKEFPNLDVTFRGAISIARRVQDPLAELVKIDPKSIGVGLYQHDVNRTKLDQKLKEVVETVVNSVGVEINTASPTLLKHVAGIGPGLAAKIVKYRIENGPYKNREELLNVPGMGPKTFQQAAGFLRIRNGKNPLDATAIHPESYPIAERLIQILTLPQNPDSLNRLQAVKAFRKENNLEEIARTLNTGLPTLEDILNEIVQPGRDPREDLPKPLLRKKIRTIADLAPEMQIAGTIQNVVDFGAFVDIGVKINGLLHNAKIPKGIHLRVGDIITAIILSVDNDRKRIALEMKES